MNDQLFRVIWVIIWTPNTDQWITVFGIALPLKNSSFVEKELEQGSEVVLELVKCMLNRCLQWFKVSLQTLINTPCTA